MAEWFKAVVLKTTEAFYVSGGSNPSPSATVQEACDNSMKPGVLFICLGNSCRSIMAEVLARHLLHDSVRVASVGLNPLGFVAPQTLEVLSELDLSILGLFSKGLDAVNVADYPLIVNLTDNAVAPHLPVACRERLLNRPIPDPYGGRLALYRRSREAIKELILIEIAPLCLSPPGMPFKPQRPRF